jgi:hypothetical protein
MCEPRSPAVLPLPTFIPATAMTFLLRNFDFVTLNPLIYDTLMDIQISSGRMLHYYFLYPTSLFATLVSRIVAPSFIQAIR